MDKSGILILLFTIVVSAVTVYVKYKEKQKYEEEVEMKKAGKTYETFDFSRNFKILDVIAILVAIGAIVYGFMIHDAVTIAMGVVVAGFFAGEFMLLGKKYRMYYNDKCFIWDTSKVEYRSIKDIRELPHAKFVYNRVSTYSGQELKIYPKAVDIIEEKMKKSVK